MRKIIEFGIINSRYVHGKCKRSVIKSLQEKYGVNNVRMVQAKLSKRRYRKKHGY